MENVAALLGWPHDELTDGQFLAELVQRTGVGLLLDVANLYTNQVNLGLDPLAALDDLPLEAIAYVHVAGGVLRDGVWHDTHAHPVPTAVLELLAAVCERVHVPGVLLERDDNYPTDAELAGELAAIRRVVEEAEPRTAVSTRRTPAQVSCRPAAPSECGAPPEPAEGSRAAFGPGGGTTDRRPGRRPAGAAPLRSDPSQHSGPGVAGKATPLAARLRPDLAEADDFRERFDSYAQAVPRPAAGTRADADAFADTVRRRRSRPRGGSA